MRGVSARTRERASGRSSCRARSAPRDGRPARGELACDERGRAVRAAAGAARARRARASATRQEHGRRTRFTTALRRESRGRCARTAPYNEWSMGKVVKLETSARAPEQRRHVAGPRGRPPRQRKRRRKTALVLGGGGFTGGVYEIGALRALDLLAVNRTVNQFDVYVGTSRRLVHRRAVRQRRDARGDDARRQPPGPTPFRDIDLGDLLRPNLLEFARKGALLPCARSALARQLVAPASARSR